MILTEIGEIGVHAGEAVYRLRPSLYAMSRIGDPKEIVEVYATVMSDALSKPAQREQFRDALAVIHCCSEDDLSGVFGYFNERLKYVVKAAEPAHILPLARCLLKHGITGALPPLPRRAGEEPEYIDKFAARDHVAMAMAHLGVSEQDAWRMTMTGLIAAMRAKFPPTESDAPGAKAPSVEDHEATMDWHDKVLAKRQKRQVH